MGLAKLMNHDGSSGVTYDRCQLCGQTRLLRPKGEKQDGLTATELVFERRMALEPGQGYATSEIAHIDHEFSLENMKLLRGIWCTRSTTKKLRRWPESWWRWMERWKAPILPGIRSMIMSRTSSALSS